jgi:N-acetylneuraminate synthase
MEKEAMEKPYIIAEVGVNYYDIAEKMHISFFEAAKLMILKAKEGGADAVKFQTYKAEKLASKNSPAYWDQNKEPTKSQYELFKKFDFFNAEEYKKLAEYAKNIDIDFFSTPFDIEAVDFLEGCNKYYKIASADITNTPLLKKIAKKGKVILLSTGASTIKEIKEALNIIEQTKNGTKVVLLHCVLSYPTLNKDANLNKIRYLQKEFPKNQIGYSDHTLPDKNMLVLTTAYLFGAIFIEKHFTLDKSLQGNDHYHAMDVNDLKRFKENIKLLNEILSKNEKDYLQCEIIPRKQARRSIVLKRDMKKDEIVREKDLTVKRPGTGISPQRFYEIIGKKVVKDLKEDYILKEKDLK